MVQQEHLYDLGYDTEGSVSLYYDACDKEGKQMHEEDWILEGKNSGIRALLLALWKSHWRRLILT